MEQHQVVVSPDERRNRIQAAIAGVEADTGLSVIVDDALLEEVVHLVENPVISMGSFNEKFLDMPAEVLITSMKNHQKFFAVNDGDLLTNRFVVLNNTAARDPGLVVRGNERVLTARLEDALFFFNEDLKKPLEEYGKSLDGQTFLKGLGSMRDKSDRISRLAATIAEQLFSVETTDIARRAGKLAKADLATQMVFEFPELQGVMGREYARASNESDAVATAIFEHYLPAFAGDELPATEAGVALSLADRLDTVAGCFSLGLVPTATKDPYALRRAILGCLRIFAERRVTVSLVPLMEAAIDNYGSEMSARKHELIPAILGFVQGRLRNWLVEQHATEVVDACLASGIGIPFDVQEKCRIVESLRSRDDYEDLIQPFKRIINITRKEKTGAFLPDNLSDDAEKTLWDAFAQAEKQAEALLNERKFAEVLAIFIELKPAIDSYFEEVLVMCEDCDLRANRLAMLARIGELFLRVADFSKILV
jgi:glycyl-tRNA synthetase beta chain